MNTEHAYGWVARILHWGIAIAIVMMFVLGLWMRDLSYYSPYYQIAPEIHKSVGMVLLALMCARLVWRVCNRQPNHNLQPFQHFVSRLIHFTLYGLIFGMMLAGYFISTLDGRSIAVFGLIEIPSIVTQKGAEKIVGRIHLVAAYCIIGLAALHAAAALYHHFVKRDGVLLSMLRGGRSRSAKNYN